MNTRLKELITLFIIQLVLTLPFYASNTFALSISNVKVSQVTANSAEVEWKTDNNATGKVNYGEAKPLGLSQRHANLVENHALNLPSLESNLTYFFSVESSDKSGNTAINNNSDSFYTFKTLERADDKPKTEAKTEAATPPEIENLTAIPRHWNRRTIDITGATKPFSSVSLFVNNMDLPKRSLSSNEMASGKFAFNQVFLDSENIIRLVVTDKAGNKNEKTFQVSVDTEQPVVKLTNITSLTLKPNLTISGTASEPVIIKVFIESSTTAAAPTKIRNLNATKISQNSIELRWEQSTDKEFSHYIVYRQDSGAIAKTQPANYNTFIDSLVDSGKEYTYEVTAVNTLGAESPKSDSLKVRTQSGGQTLNLKHAPVDLLEDTGKPSFIGNASGSFEFGVRLDKGDGTYNIRLVLEDKALNRVVIDKLVTLDTKKPEVKITSPQSGAFLYENIANEITIVGKTKPNARVHLFINRFPFNVFEKTLEASGFDIDVKAIEERVQNLSEKELESNCPLRATGCNGADRSTTADAQGNFKFDKVDLTAAVGFGARLSEVSPTEFRDVQLNQEARETRKTTIIVVATDNLGRRGAAKQNFNIGTCWSGNQSWDTIPLTQSQSPVLLSTERLAEGKETINFYINYSYIGRGQNANIRYITMTKACATREIIDPRFNISCQVMPSGAPTRLLNPPDNTVSYSSVQLARFPGMDRFLAADWKAFFKAINKELTFPLKVHITYEHEVLDENGVSKRVTETQTTCEQVSFVVDNTIIDPRTVLPDFILYDFVDFLQTSIDGLTKMQEQVNRVLGYVGYGCLGSFLYNFAIQFWRRMVVFSEEKILASKTLSQLSELFGTGTTTLRPAKEEDKEYCEQLVEMIADKYGSFKMKYVNDIDLKRCFPKSASAWDREATAYKWSRWSCDRVFGHAAPSRWTEDKNNDELLRKVETQEGCAVDEGVTGLPFKVENCIEFARKNPTYKAAADFGADAKCVKLVEGNRERVYTLGELVSPEERLYRFNHITTQGSLSGEFIYAVRSAKSEFDFVTARPKTCEEVCGIGLKKGQKARVFKSDKGTLGVVTTEPKEQKPEEAGEDKKVSPPPLAGCTIVDTCRSYQANRRLYFEGTEYSVISAETRGYAKDCFYDQNENDPYNVVSDESATREECCCINTKAEAVSNYYEKDDIDIVHFEKGSQQVPVHESKKSTASVIVPAESYQDMKWSYRYWRERFAARGVDSYESQIHTEYNRYRYIEGRDKSACFGMNNFFYQLRGDAEKVLVVDPARQHEAAFQCLHLAGISQRIQFLKNLMASLSTCLIQVRTSGRGDAGACKELFTQYLCNSIWQMIRWFANGCAPVGVGIDFEKQNEKSIGYVRAGFKGIYESINDMQSQITQEYGNAKLNELLGTGEESLARKVCLAAFGYDWELTARNLVDAAYTTPFATLVQPVTRSREYLTVDPLKLIPKYEYRASWVINPGCDFDRYDVYLSCVGRKQLDSYPNSVNCGGVGARAIGTTATLGSGTAYSSCDCRELADEKLGPLLISGRLKQNILEDSKAVHLIHEENYRYDHLKFVLRPDRRILPNLRPNCFPTGFDDGVFYFPLIDKSPSDILDCSVQPLSGVITCGASASYANRAGITQLVSVTINDLDAEKNKDKITLNQGDSLLVGARVVKSGKDKCIRYSVTPDIPIQTQTLGIKEDGANDLPVVNLGEQRIVSRSGTISADRVDVKIRSLNNQEPIRITVQFKDNDKTADNKPHPERGKYSEDDIVIIDDWEVKDGRLQPKQGKQETKITKVEGKTITVEKQDATVEINGVAYPQPPTPTSPYEWSTVLTIFPLQQAVETTQQKTLLIELFHLKDDREAFATPEDCNFANKILDRPYKFTVSLLHDKPETLGPRIQISSTYPPTQIIGEGLDVTVSGQITHKNGIYSAEVSIIDKNNRQIIGESAKQIYIEGNKPEGGNFQYLIKTKDLPVGTYEGNVLPIGTYEGNVKAIAKKADGSAGELSNAKFKFEIKPK